MDTPCPTRNEACSLNSNHHLQQQSKNRRKWQMSDGWIGFILGMVIGIHAGVFMAILGIAWPVKGSWRSELLRGTADEQDDERRDD